MKYYSQYHSHELFEPQESLSGLSKSNRIVSIYQPHLRPIVRGKAKAKVEFGAKIGASIVNGYTYVDHLSWDAYNESSDLAMQLELYKKRFGMLPQEVQADKLYLGKANRNLIKDCHVECYNHPLGRPPKDENDRHAEDKRRAIGERNEVEATFGTSKRVYRANDIRAKLDDTADTWIGACFFAKNVMKFLRGLLCLIFAKSVLGFIVTTSLFTSAALLPTGVLVTLTMSEE